MSEKSAISDYPNAKIRKQPFLSLVWLIPLIALLIGIGLMVKVYREKGPSIVIDFENARGIEAGRTHIRYKDVDIGKVTDVKLVRRAKATEMGENVIQDRALVTAELKSFMQDYLGEETVFWVVRPRISMGEVSGLSTLFSGFYIEMDPGTKRNGWKEIYPGLDKPPKVTSYDRGTIISLNAKALGSLHEGSPVYYRQLKVGEVIGSELDSRTESVDISIYIKDKYADKVKSNTRFWNVSGIDVNVTPSGGISARMESLTAFVIGGVAFETPKHESNSVDLLENTVFHLYDSYKTAQEDTARDQKLYYVMYFDDTLFGLVKDSTLEYQGVQIGKVESIILQTDNTKGKIQTVVKVSVFVDKLSLKANKLHAEKLLKKLVAKGLHAQLKTSSLLTGAQYIALVYPDKKSSQASLKKGDLNTTMANHIASFPTTYAATSILNFDASSLTTELTKTIKEVRHVVSSKDIKKIVLETGKLANNLSKITKSLHDKGISGELVRTLQTTQNAIVEIQTAVKTSQTMLKQIEKTALTTQSSVQQSLGEDSALQYKLQVMLDELSETANSFSVLADTLQRKPNSIVFGK
jgi:paraquat-inducible protein B